MMNISQNTPKIKFITIVSRYSAVKTNHLMTYKAKVAVYSEILTKHSPQSEQHVELCNVKPGGT